jgi:hypothetical protein
VLAAAAAAAALLAAACGARAQELEPRAYSASPVGTNFLIAGYSRLKGEVLTDPSLPIKNVQADIELLVAGYARTFALAGRTASFGAVLPFVRGNVSGDVFDAPREVHRAAFGDARLRLALNLYGNPAMTPQEFAQREPGLVVGASVSAVLPTGHYMSSRLVNEGTNRWAIKPDAGFSYPIGNWFIEGSGGAWLYADNTDFLGGKRRSQDPMYIVQTHAGYNFRPGLWIAIDAARFTGGRSSIDGVRNEDAQHNSRYGATLSVPVASGWSMKLGWSKGFQMRAGGDYDVYSVALQYRWFDR